MIITNFQIKNKANRLKFFEKTFLIADIKFEVILKMFFLKISKIDILFGKKNSYLEVLHYQQHFINYQISLNY